MNNYELEVCVDSLESAIEAERLEVDRVELCARLDLDGLTPSLELVEKCRNSIAIGLHVIVRPREGDFNYNSTEVEQMLTTIEKLVKLGVDGIVSGALNADGTLDEKTTRQLKATAQNSLFTFHRAFDVCKTPFETVRKLEELGIDYLLSSGQQPTAIEGADLLGELAIRSKQLKIMAGSGVNASNIPDLWKRGIRNFHFTSHQPVRGVNRYDVQKTKDALKILKSL